MNDIVTINVERKYRNKPIKDRFLLVPMEDIQKQLAQKLKADGKEITGGISQLYFEYKFGTVQPSLRGWGLPAGPLYRLGMTSKGLSFSGIDPVCVTVDKSVVSDICIDGMIDTGELKTSTNFTLIGSSYVPKGSWFSTQDKVICTLNLNFTYKEPDLNNKPIEISLKNSTIKNGIVNFNENFSISDPDDPNVSKNFTGFRCIVDTPYKPITNPAEVAKEKSPKTTDLKFEFVQHSIKFSNCYKYRLVDLLYAYEVPFAGDKVKNDETQLPCDLMVTSKQYNKGTKLDLSSIFANEHFGAQYKEDGVPIEVCYWDNKRKPSYAQYRVFEDKIVHMTKK